MKRRPASKSAKKPANRKPGSEKKRGGKMPPELLDRFQKKSGKGKDKDLNTAGMKKGKGMPAAGRPAGKAEAKGERSGADKRKGTPRGTGMMTPKKGASSKK